MLPLKNSIQIKMIIELPKQNELVVTRTIKTIDSPTITAPDGTMLSVSVPRDRKEFKQAWKVLEGYTKWMAPNPESGLQDPDELKYAMDYHFGTAKPRERASQNAMGYLVFTAVEKSGKIRAVAPAEIISIADALDELVERALINKKQLKNADGRRISFIHQIGVDSKISEGYTNLSVATQLYQHVTGLLPQVTGYKESDKRWLGVVTESRNKGPERKAIEKAMFDVLVTNRYWRPPSTQDVSDPKNTTTKDLVLLANGVQKDSRYLAAISFLAWAYCEEQNLKGALSLLNKYFSNQKCL